MVPLKGKERSPWPSDRLLDAARRGILPLTGTLKGWTAAGLPWVMWNGAAVGCSRCGGVQPGSERDVLDVFADTHAICDRVIEED